MTLILLLACTGDTITSEFDTEVEADALLDTGADADTDSEPETPTIQGQITYSEDLVEDGFGNIYVAVFDKDPVWNSNSATALGRQVLRDVDFNIDGPPPSYSVSGIPPRSSAYYLLAFFDDNGTASDTEPAPDKGDLISFDQTTLGSPQIVVSGSATHDIDLNMKMPW